MGAFKSKLNGSTIKTPKFSLSFGSVPKEKENYTGATYIINTPKKPTTDGSEKVPPERDFDLIQLKDPQTSHPFKSRFIYGPQENSVKSNDISENQYTLQSVVYNTNIRTASRRGGDKIMRKLELQGKKPKLCSSGGGKSDYFFEILFMWNGELTRYFELKDGKRKELPLVPFKQMFDEGITLPEGLTSKFHVRLIAVGKLAKQKCVEMNFTLVVRQVGIWERPKIDDTQTLKRGQSRTVIGGV